MYINNECVPLSEDHALLVEDQAISAVVYRECQTE